MSYIQEALAGQKVLVTGATGFIGGRLAQRLAAEEGAIVTGTGRSLEKASYLAAAGVGLQAVDLRDEAAMRTAVAGQAVIFHAAAWVGGGRMPDDLAAARDLNVAATETLVRLAAGANQMFKLGLPLNRQRLKFLTRPAVYPIDKAKRLLGYEPRVSLDEGMQMAKAWLRQAGYL